MDPPRRLSLAKVPDKTHLYPGWRDEFAGAILACGLGRRRAVTFLEEMAYKTEAELQQLPADDREADLDALIWAD